MASPRALREMQKDSPIVWGLRRGKKSLPLIIPAHQAFFYFFFFHLPRLWLILCSCLAAPSPLLLLLLSRSLPVALPEPGRPGQRHISCQLGIVNREQSQGCLSCAARSRRASQNHRRSLAPAPGAEFPPKSTNNSPLPGPGKVCSRNQPGV